MKSFIDIQTQINNDYEEVKKEADKTIKKAKIPLVVRAARSIPYSLQMAVYAVIVPYFTQSFTDINIIWPGIAVVLSAILLRLVKDDFQLNARVWWAKKTVNLYTNVLNLVNDYKELEDNYLQGSQKITSLDRALITISGILKSNILEKYHSEIDISDNKFIRINMNERIKYLRTELLNLCKYVSEILGGPEQAIFRCGLLIENPDNKEELIPLVVYNPNDEDYVSTNVYSKKTDFSGRLLTQFNKNRKRTNWKDFAIYIIDDIDKVKANEPHVDFRPIILREQQDFRSIAGNVIYCKNDDKEIKILGVINIDSHEPNALNEYNYKNLQIYLHSAFRLIAERLLILEKYPNLIKEIWHNKSLEAK